MYLKWCHYIGVFCQYNYGYNPYQQAYGGRPGYVAQWPQRQYNQYSQISNQGSSNDWVLTGVRSLRPEQGALVKPGFVNRYNPPVSRPEYNQYSKPGYSQYSKPEYNQYNRPRYNQYSRPNYNQYSKPGYNQYNPEYNQYDRRVDMSYLAPVSNKCILNYNKINYNFSTMRIQDTLTPDSFRKSMSDASLKTVTKSAAWNWWAEADVPKPDVCVMPVFSITMVVQ